MKIFGIIMEINPLHNGHIYFLNQVPKKKGDILVAVISTTVVQRGEISILDKKTKASLLLEYGVDIVVELPAIHANQGGEFFAFNAINILKEFKITDLVFGSESNDLASLLKVSKQVNPNDFKNGIHKSNLQGLKSNDILGISYLKALKNSNINVILVQRIKNNYNDNTFSASNIQSATAIRNGFFADDDITAFLPTNALNSIYTINQSVLYQMFLLNLKNALDNNITIMLSENNQLLYKLEKILKTKNFDSIEQLAVYASDKNNSKYKIQRIIINTIFLVDHHQVKNTVEYLHLLGFSRNGASYLKKLNNDKIITSLKHQNSYPAKCELRISATIEALSSIPKNLDYQAPVIK